MKSYIKTKRFKFNLNITSNGFHISLWKKPTIWTEGLTSRTPDHKHIIMLDYDNTARDFIEEELLMLIKSEKLSPFYLTSSSTEKQEPVKHGNYHAYSLTKVTLHRLYEIVENTNTDPLHKTISSWANNIYKSNVLRTQPKTKDGKQIREAARFIKIIGNSNYNQPTSSGHHLALLRQFPTIPILPYQKEDHYNYCYDVKFNTYKP